MRFCWMFLHGLKMWHLCILGKGASSVSLSFSLMISIVNRWVARLLDRPERGINTSLCLAVQDVYYFESNLAVSAKP